MSETPVTLEFIARQNGMILGELAQQKADMAVLLAILAEMIGRFRHRIEADKP